MRFVEMALPRGGVAGHQKANASKLVVGEVEKIVDGRDLSSVVEGEEVECNGQANELLEDKINGTGGKQSLQVADVVVCYLGFKYQIVTRINYPIRDVTDLTCYYIFPLSLVLKP